MIDDEKPVVHFEWQAFFIDTKDAFSIAPMGVTSPAEKRGYSGQRERRFQKCPNVYASKKNLIFAS
ncbi:hypothetical protein FEDK69T_14060 [Flavobacterium enshiense DK69]|nr:hypothetical protein FEDK69T_14060 [Flavobacterium enshiense DK69]